ncbi:MAG: M67 family metallopeptidase [Sedimentisphaerales bacterium]|nr:M67 family metallopeptidase [Sedimentisphaerales bacterium]
MALKLSQAIYEQMVEQARREAPIEACGMLAGKNSVVARHFAMTNSDQSSDHFMMEPKEQFGVIKQIRAEGLDFLGVYHSHPASPARPSQEDIRLALTGGIAYVIVSLLDNSKPVIKAFNIENGNVSETNIQIVSNTDENS